MELLIYALYAVASTYALLVLYIFVMSIKRVRDMGKLTTFVKVICYPWVILGVLVDVIVNQTVFAIICLDPFHFGTVTSRLKGYKYREGTKWQKVVSAWVESHIDPFDDAEGGHI